MVDDGQGQNVTRPPVTGRERAAILSSLGAGVVPRVGLPHIQVGRVEEVKAIVEDIKGLEQGSAFVRFIVGPYGAGKSFFLNLMQAVALERKVVVARADMTTQRRLSASDGKARALYAELMRNLATRGRPGGGALSNLVESWIADVAREVGQGQADEEGVVNALGERLEPLQQYVSGFDFARVLGAYYKGYLRSDEHLQASAARWLRGEYSTKTEARNDLGVRTIIDDDNLYDYLKLFAGFCRIAGYGGLLVCLDELVVLSHRLNSKVARNNNYEALLRIVNDCLQGSVEGLGFLFGATDDCMFDDRRGLFSYEALATRLKENRFAGEGLVDLAGPTLRLQPLSPEECYVMLSNVRRVFAKGDDAAAQEMLPDEAIAAYLQSCQERMGAAYFQTPRETVKDFVGLLNVLEQNPGADWQALVGEVKTTKKDVQTEDPALTGPADEDEADEDDGLASFKL